MRFESQCVALAAQVREWLSGGLSVPLLAQLVVRGDGADELGAALGAFLRCAARENPKLSMQVVRVSAAMGAA